MDMSNILKAIAERTEEIVKIELKKELKRCFPSVRYNGLDLWNLDAYELKEALDKLNVEVRIKQYEPNFENKDNTTFITTVKNPTVELYKKL